MTALLAARRQHLAAALSLHAHAKSVGLGAAAFPRLISTLWQSIPPMYVLRVFRLRKTSSLNAWAANAAGSLELPRWLGGLPWSSRSALFRAAFGII